MPASDSSLNPDDVALLPVIPARPFRWALTAGLGSALLAAGLFGVALQAFEGLRHRLAGEGARYRSFVLTRELRSQLQLAEQSRGQGAALQGGRGLVISGQPGSRPVWAARDDDTPQLLLPLGDGRTQLRLSADRIASAVLDGTDPAVLRQFSLGLRTLPGHQVIAGDALSFELPGSRRQTVQVRGVPLLELAIAPRPLPLSAYAVPLLLVGALSAGGTTAGYLLGRSRNRQLQRQSQLNQDRASLLWLTRHAGAQPFRLPIRPEGPAMQDYITSGQALLLPGHSPWAIRSGSTRLLLDEFLTQVHPDDRSTLLPLSDAVPAAERVVPARPWSVRLRLRQADESWRWHELRAQRVAQEPLEIVQGVLLDVDDQVRSQQRCTLQVDLISLISAQGGVWPYRMPLPEADAALSELPSEDPLDLLLPQVDPQLVELGRPDLLLQDFLARVHPEDRPILVRHHQRLAQAPLHSRQECTYRLKLPGWPSWLTVLDRAEVVQELPRRIVQGVLLDLDERERLQTHERQLWTRIQTAQVTLESITRLGGLFFLDYPLLAWQDPRRCAPEDFTLSRTCLEFLELPAGVSLQEWMQRLQERIHPADLPRVQAHYRRLPADPEQTREQRFRMQLPQGCYTTILCRSRLQSTDAGWRVQGVGFDLGLTVSPAATQTLPKLVRLPNPD